SLADRSSVARDRVGHTPVGHTRVGQRGPAAGRVVARRLEVVEPARCRRTGFRRTGRSGSQPAPVRSSRCGYYRRGLRSGSSSKGALGAEVLGAAAFGAEARGAEARGAGAWGGSGRDGDG